VTTILDRAASVLPPSQPQKREERSKPPSDAIPAWVMFFASFAAYTTIGSILAVRYGYIVGDALSRTADAQFAVNSRDPHLSAIGFVFGPLPTVCQIPVQILANWWPDVTRYGIAGIVVSAAFMAAFLVQLALAIRDRGASRHWAFGIAVVVGLMPMIIIYGANGMSEAPFLFFVTWAVRRLIRWQRTDDVHDLTAAGLAIGLCYLVRYEALVVGVIGVLVIALRHRVRGWRSNKVLMDSSILLMPLGITFAFWTGVSWLITGDAFAQFSSVYGNSAVLAQSRAGGGSTAVTLSFPIIETLVLTPTLPIIAVLGLWLAIKRRDIDVLPVLLIYGAVLGFEAVSVLRGSTFPFLRYYVLAIPAAALLVAFLREGSGAMEGRRPGLEALAARPVLEPSSLKRALSSLAVVVLLIAPFPLTIKLMASPTRAPQEYYLQAVFDASGSSDEAMSVLRTFTTERLIASYLDSLQLPESSVLVDTSSGFAIVAASTHPRQFVITSDRDFVRDLNDPHTYGIRYILAVPDTGRGVADAINRRYPTMYDTGADVAQLAFLVPQTAADQLPWKVYRVNLGGESGAG
jgi:hypothetical protein